MDPIESIIPSEVLAAVRESTPQGMPLYLVGGAVRDALLGLNAHDLDFTLGTRVKATARKTAEILGAAFYSLDEERSNYRLIYVNPKGDRRTIDFAGMRGPDIEADLRPRDFTINAMALDVMKNSPVIDPTGGSQDLKNRILRMCAESAFQDDPVRILRGLRLAPSYGLHIEESTRVAMAANMQNLERVSPERKRDELFRILEADRPSVALRALEMLGGLPYLLPDLVSLKDNPQTNPHYQNVWDHTLSVLDNLGLLLKVLAIEPPKLNEANLKLAEASLKLGRYRSLMADHFQQEISLGRSLAGLVNLAVLFHDAAKPGSMSVDADGRIHNFGHEKAGARLIFERAQAFMLSRQECERLKIIVANHMRIHSLVATGEPPSRRAIYRFYQDTGEAGIDICLHTLADVLGTYGPALQQDTWRAYLNVCRMLLEAWWEKRDERVDPPVLLNGNDIQQLFHIEPGPRLGMLLDSLHETQAAGLVHTRGEAIEYLENMVHNEMN